MNGILLLCVSVLSAGLIIQDRVVPVPVDQVFFFFISQAQSVFTGLFLGYDSRGYIRNAGRTE